MRSASRLLSLALGSLVSVCLALAVNAAERVPSSAVEHAGLVLLATLCVVGIVILGCWAFRE